MTCAATPEEKKEFRKHATRFRKLVAKLGKHPQRIDDYTRILPLVWRELVLLQYADKHEFDNLLIVKAILHGEHPEISHEIFDQG